MTATSSAATRRRRGKKDNAAAAAAIDTNNSSQQPTTLQQPTAAATTDAKKKKGSASSTTLEEQLNHAQESIERSQAAVNILHQQWKSYLLRLSYFCFFISLHQTYRPAMSCWKDVQAVNDDAVVLSTLQSILFVVGDSLIYVLAIAISTFLILFLHKASSATTTTSFGNPWFLLANACIPVIAGLRYLENNSSISGGDGSRSSCLETAWFLEPLSLPETLRRRQPEHDSATLEQGGEEDLQVGSRSFPVILLFHSIVTACIWFMMQQSRQQEKNLLQVKQLRAQLSQETKKKKDKKTTTATGSKKTK